ncbi:D-ribose pyranase [Soehngenia longivitae]|jgi:D-ribose pyranase|uniref:D-ribose pyranase n=1 Tax=Soehngenia longivitae TaxID=2562294 RepID=A0A4Z0D898_9FIRM|nr:D-ribose pyranase [Soehngenia longivitae]TFZ41098.1 D-ribose pyranase [Soehngenia longivitae]
MKKRGILNGELSKLIAEMGHMDMILIGDAGMPVPKGVKLIDLALVEGVPRFIEVVKAVLEELKVEEAYIDLELKSVSPNMKKNLDSIINGEFKVTEVEHEKLKEISKECKAVIRTGEFTPYSNIILKSGVVF